MTGTCGSPLWPWAAGAATTTRARVFAGRPGRNAKESSSVSATPKIFLARNSFERERGIKILLAETNEGLTTEVAAHRVRRAGRETTRPGRKAARARPPAWGEKTFLAASELRGESGAARASGAKRNECQR